jgi:hypothetical protein
LDFDPAAFPTGAAPPIPAAAVQRNSSELPSGSYNSAAVAPLISRAASQTSTRGCELSNSPWTTAVTRSSMCSRRRASPAWKRAAPTSRWVARPMIELTATDSSAARYWLCGYAGGPISSIGPR